MSHSRLHDSFFAPPKFLTMPAIGIDISERSIKYAELFLTKDGYNLGRYGNIPLQAGVVEDGRIVNQVELSNVLDKLRIDKNLSFVRATLPEEQVYFFRARYPTNERATLRSTIELSLEEHVPIPVAEAVFDFEITSQNPEDTDVAVTVATKNTVESYTDVFRGAGLALLSLELEANPIARSVIDINDTGAHLIVDFGEARTGVSIVSGGNVYMTSTVSVGGEMLTEAVSRHLKISLIEAENLKCEFGLQKNSEHEELFAILLTNIAILRDEINKHLIYWHTHLDENGETRKEIEKIILLGGDSNLPGLPEYLSASLRITVEIGNVWNNVSLPKRGIPELSRADSLSYATAIGLALYQEKYE